MCFIAFPMPSRMTMTMMMMMMSCHGCQCEIVTHDGRLSTVVTKHVGLFYGHRRYLYAGITTIASNIFYLPPSPYPMTLLVPTDQNHSFASFVFFLLLFSYSHTLLLLERLSDCIK